MDRVACQKYRCLVEPKLDGALDTAVVVEVEEHLDGCAGCREYMQFARSVRNSVKRAVAAPASAALRARIEASVRAERERAALAASAPEAAPSINETGAVTVAVVEARAEALTTPAWKRPVRARVVQSLRSWGPAAAAAAALLFAWNSRRVQQEKQEAQLIPQGVLGDMVAEHSHPLPPERTEPSEVRALERYVGVPVSLPFQEGQRARLVGGRVMPLRAQRAAMLQYEIQDRGQPRRVSVFIYDPSRIQVDGEGLNAVGAAKVRVGRANGYSVAVTQHNGVGYAVTSDMDPEEMAALADNVH